MKPFTYKEQMDARLAPGGLLVVAQGGDPPSVESIVDQDLSSLPMLPGCRSEQLGHVAGRAGGGGPAYDKAHQSRQQCVAAREGEVDRTLPGQLDEVAQGGEGQGEDTHPDHAQRRSHGGSQTDGGRQVRRSGASTWRGSARRIKGAKAMAQVGWRVERNGRGRRRRGGVEDRKADTKGAAHPPVRPVLESHPVLGCKGIYFLL